MSLVTATVRGIIVTTSPPAPAASGRSTTRTSPNGCCATAPTPTSWTSRWCAGCTTSYSATRTRQRSTRDGRRDRRLPHRRGALPVPGSIFWKMTAGMGDVVIAPLYQALRRRGVQFEFFHRVDALHLDASRQAVDAITMGRQVRLADGVDHYEPLTTVRGLPVFPDAPLLDQIEPQRRSRRPGNAFRGSQRRRDSACCAEAWTSTMSCSPCPSGWSEWSPANSSPTDPHGRT